MYPFSRKYFSRRGTRKDSILSNIFFQRSLFFLLNSVVSVLSIRNNLIKREKEREREEKIIGVGETVACFVRETRSWIG